MKRTLLIALALLFAVPSCTRVPITGRKQVKLLPEDQMVAMSLTQYKDFLQKNKVVATGQEEQMVKAVAAKVIEGVKKVAKEKGFSSQIAGYKWEVNLVQSADVNAWCMPGGKIVVYTGILPFTVDESGLATVLGHEVAHAVARHGNERMSQGLIAQTGLTALDIALSQKPKQTHDLLMAAVGAGAEIGVLLPFSRKQESEADQLGLIFMAVAGYDPHGAVAFWKRMASQGGQKPPEFLSTHPSDETRINNIEKKYMSEAMAYYKH